MQFISRGHWNPREVVLCGVLLGAAVVLAVADSLLNGTAALVDRLLPPR